MTQDFGYPGEQEAYSNEVSQVHAKMDKIMELLQEMNKDIKEMKKEDEARDRSHDALVKQVQQIAEDVAQIKRDREDLANGVMIDNDVEEEVVDPPNHDDVSSNSELTTVVEEPTVEVIQVFSNPPLELNMLTNKCREDDSSVKERKASLLDLWQIVIKWPNNGVSNGSMASKKVKAHHINYRSFMNNSVGKCGSLLPEMKPMSVQEQREAYLVNHRAYIGNVVGKCALRPP